MANAKTEAHADVYECGVPFACEVDGVLRSVRHGERVRGDDPAYQTAPGYFYAAGAPHAERVGISDFIGDGLTTKHTPIPDGWRRDRHPDFRKG
jgi:hypothetical protein